MHIEPGTTHKATAACSLIVDGGVIPMHIEPGTTPFTAGDLTARHIGDTATFSVWGSTAMVSGQIAGVHHDANPGVDGAPEHSFTLITIRGHVQVKVLPDAPIKLGASLGK